MLLEILFRVKQTVQFGALVAGAIFIDEGTPVVENILHDFPGIQQCMFNHPFRHIENRGDLCNFEIKDLLQQHGQLLFDLESFTNACEAEVNMFLTSNFREASFGLSRGILK
ncbi:MAG: hypothetical protein WDN75_18215 [Bacteroidota bacterium]